MIATTLATIGLTLTTAAPVALFWLGLKDANRHRNLPLGNLRMGEQEREHLLGGIALQGVHFAERQTQRRTGPATEQQKLAAAKEYIAYQARKRGIALDEDSLNGLAKNAFALTRQARLEKTSQ